MKYIKCLPKNTAGVDDLAGFRFVYVWRYGEDIAWTVSIDVRFLICDEIMSLMP